MKRKGENDVPPNDYLLRGLHRQKHDEFIREAEMERLIREIPPKGHKVQNLVPTLAVIAAVVIFFVSIS